MRTSDVVHSMITGPRRRRRWLTLVGAVVFAGLVLGVVFASLWTDRALVFPMFLPGWHRVVAGGCLLAAGLPFWMWCVVLFWRGNAHIGRDVDAFSAFYCMAP